MPTKTYRKNIAGRCDPFFTLDDAVICGTDSCSSYAYALRIDRRLFKDILRLHATTTGAGSVDDARLDRNCPDWYTTDAETLRATLDQQDGSMEAIEQPRIESQKLVVTDDMFYCRGYERYSELPLETQAIYFNSDLWCQIARHFGAASAMRRNRYGLLRRTFKRWPTRRA